MELFDRIDQGLYDWVFFVLALAAALIVAVPVNKGGGKSDAGLE